MYTFFVKSFHINWLLKVVFGLRVFIIFKVSFQDV